MINVRCARCGKAFRVFPSRLKAAGKRIFCTLRCQVRTVASERTGSRNPAWQGGRIRMNGYVYLLVDGKYRAEHRLIMERILGRRLDRREVVHHKNGVRHDNRRANLEVLGLSKHSRDHQTARNVLIRCETCGREVLRKPSSLKGMKHHFCGARCFAKWQKGKPLPWRVQRGLA
jgi:endogenous inhibitor of DNA gyrase (YacG/DUF329 family)